MNALKVFDYEGSPIQFEVVDGQIMANATLMCKPFGKKPAKWLELPSTKRYMEALKVKSENRTPLLNAVSGNYSDGRQQGTWIHEKLILKLAQWLDVGFEIWCDEKIAELLKNGTASIGQGLTSYDMIIEMAQRGKEMEEQLGTLEQKVSKLLTIQAEAEACLKRLPVAQEKLPEKPLRTIICRHVKEYAASRNIPYAEVWRQVYKELYDSYRYSLKARKKKEDKTLLDVAERVGCLDKMYVITSNLISA